MTDPTLRDCAIDLVLTACNRTRGSQVLVTFQTDRQPHRVCVDRLPKYKAKQLADDLHALGIAARMGTYDGRRHVVAASFD